MEGQIIRINKEKYALRKLKTDIILTKKILSDIVDELPRECFKKGEYHFERDEFKKAAEWYSKAIEDKPDFVVALCKRGFSYHYVSEYEQAKIDFDKAIDLKADYYDAFLGRAHTFMRLNDHEEAIWDLSKCMELEPNDGELWFYRALIYDQTGNIKGALEDWVNAAKKGNVVAQTLTEEEFRKSKKIIDENYNNYDVIARISNEIIKSSNKGDLFYQRALAKARLGDFKNSIADFNLAQAHGKGDGLFFFRKAYAQEELKDVQGAIDDYSKAIEAWLQNTEKEKANKFFYYNLGWAAVNLANNQFNLGNELDSTTHYEEAVKYLDKSIELDKNYGMAYGARGLAKRMLASLYQGTSKAKLGYREDACADFKRAIELGDSKAIEYFKEYCSN